VIQTALGGAWSDEIPAPLPMPNAAGSELNDLDCVTSASCVGVGQYYVTNTPLVSAGLIDVGAGNAYTATKAPVPAGAATNPNELLYAVSCPSVGVCVAAGTYYQPSSILTGLLATESGASPTWKAAVVPAVHGAFSFLRLPAISCVASYGCVAVGYFEPTSGAVGGEIVTAPA
jgi:hypothetical protein